ncbi:hypothetical protein A4E84_04315 [Streptomyces qaidamensis]|uniref:AMP-dependent synthetase/ligase domain-containing protein n=1 Tax=Streptomyces qaidamensis TaxID=1783515 RepID=A0A143BUG9_9ACTN|nr:hypothetical protein A4E84_04315 [Streptomyces qaidamensis]
MDRSRALADEHGATLPQTLLAALMVLIGRYSGSDVVAVALEGSGATVHRTDLSGDPSFAELLEQVRRGGSDRDLGQDMDLSSDEAPAIVAVRVGDTGEGLAGEVQYSTALFDAATVERLGAHLVTVLEAVAADAGQRVGDLSVLAVGECEELVAGGDGGCVALPLVGGVHGLIAEWAVAVPDAVAVVAGGESVTYGGLMVRANRLAHLLRGMGVGAESVVGLCLPRGVDMVVAVLAVWQAGGAYLPLDPEYPADRLEFMLADAGVQVLVGERSVAGGLPVDAVHGRVVWLDDPAVVGVLDELPSAAPDVTTVADQLAYVIYTSGSTGRPKGVQVAQGGVVNLALALRSALGVEPGVRVLQFASQSFDAAVLDVVVTLAGGGALVVASSEQRRVPAELQGLVRAEGVVSASVSPSLLGVLDEAALAGVGSLFVGTERVGEAVVREWAPGRRFFVGYGPTEITVIACAGLADPDAQGAPAIGRPLANTQVYVLDAQGFVAPVGSTEELVAGVWAGVLGLDRVGADSFFELGGLLATQVISRIREVRRARHVGGSISRPCGAWPRVAQASGTVAPPMTVADRAQPLPGELWFLDQFHRIQPAHADPAGRRAGPGRPDYRAGCDGRAEVLRTRLVADADGVPHQVIDPPGLPARGGRCVRRGGPRHVRGGAAARRCDAAVRGGRPVVRATLTKVADEKYVLLLTAHHVIFDEWSDHLFQHELSGCGRAEPAASSARAVRRLLRLAARMDVR